MNRGSRCQSSLLHPAGSRVENREIFNSLSYFTFHISAVISVDCNRLDCKQNNAVKRIEIGADDMRSSDKKECGELNPIRHEQPECSVLQSGRDSVA